MANNFKDRLIRAVENSASVTATLSSSLHQRMVTALSAVGPTGLKMSVVGMAAIAASAVPPEHWRVGLEVGQMVVADSLDRADFGVPDFLGGREINGHLLGSDDIEELLRSAAAETGVMMTVMPARANGRIKDTAARFSVSDSGDPDATPRVCTVYVNQYGPAAATIRAAHEVRHCLRGDSIAVIDRPTGGTYMPISLGHDVDDEGFNGGREGMELAAEVDADVFAALVSLARGSVEEASALAQLRYDRWVGADDRAHFSGPVLDRLIEDHRSGAIQAIAIDSYGKPLSELAGVELSELADTLRTQHGYTYGAADRAAILGVSAARHLDRGVARFSDSQESRIVTAMLRGTAEGDHLSERAETPVRSAAHSHGHVHR